jgi:uncharacterized protein (TIGR03437 family)
VFGGKNTAATSTEIDLEGRAYVIVQSPEADFPLSADVYHGPVGDRGVWLARWSPAESARNVLACISDAADLTLTGKASPGRLLTLWGSFPGVGSQAFDTDAQQAPAKLGGVRVLFDDVPGRLLYVSEGQINVAVPFTAASSPTVTLRIEKDGDIIESHRLGVVARAPRVFRQPEATGAACNRLSAFGLIPIALNEDGSANSCESPAAPGSLVTLFLNGAGVPESPIEDGVVARPPLLPLRVPVNVSIRDRGLEVVSVTAAEGHIAGVWQVMFRIPSDVDRLANLVVRLDGIRANLEFDEFLVWVSPIRR